MEGVNTCAMILNNNTRRSLVSRGYMLHCRKPGTLW